MLKGRKEPRRICTGSDTDQISVAVVLIVALLFRWLRELLLPAAVCFRSIDVGEYKVEDFGVPGDRLAFNAFLDVL